MAVTFKTGIRLPKYGFRLISEQILKNASATLRFMQSSKCLEHSVQLMSTDLGTRNSASSERMSKDMSMM